jgi:hypothetical protein
VTHFVQRLNIMFNPYQIYNNTGVDAGVMIEFDREYLETTQIFATYLLTKLYFSPRKCEISVVFHNSIYHTCDYDKRISNLWCGLFTAGYWPKPSATE